MKIELNYNNPSILNNYFILEYKLLLFFYAFINYQDIKKIYNIKFIIQNLYPEYLIIYSIINVIKLSDGIQFLIFQKNVQAIKHI